MRRGTTIVEARRSCSGWLLGSLAILASAGGAASAQTLIPEPLLSQSAAPSQSQRSDAEERRAPDRALPAAPTAVTGGGDPRTLTTMSEIDIDGATAIPPDTIQATLALYRGRPVSQSDLAAITQAVTELYRSAGFHLTRAVILPQDLGKGRLRITVVEGSVEEIVVGGDASGSFGIAALLAPISAERPSRRATLERQLLLANDRPGIRIGETTLDEIVPASGRFRLTVSVHSWSAYAAVGFDNAGSEAVGPWQASASAALNSIGVSGDSLTIAGSTIPNSSRELRFGRVGYDMPLGTDGVRIGASVSRSSVWPGDERRSFRAQSLADTYEVHAAYAPVLARSQALWLTGSLAISDVSEQNAFGLAYSDRIRFASLSADYKLNAVEGSWTYLNATYRQGLGLVDSRSDSLDWLSRPGASSHFSLLNGSITHYQNLIDGWSLKLAAAGQVASGPLLASQQYYLGGNWFGRGFAGGWIAGDDAAAASAEIRFDQATNFAFAKGYQLYGFIEGGLTATRLDEKDLIQRIGSAGIGLRVFISDELQLGVAIAKPIAYRSPLHHDRGTTVLFSLTNAVRLCPTQELLRC